MTNTHGFSILELLVVLTISSLIVVAAAPAVNKLKEIAQSSQAVSRITQLLDRAQRNSLKSGLVTQVRLNDGPPEELTAETENEVLYQIAVSPWKLVLRRSQAPHRAINSIFFFPDGTSSGALITIEAERWQRRIHVPLVGGVDP